MTSRAAGDQGAARSRRRSAGRSRLRISQTLALISEYATPTRVDIVAGSCAYELVIRAVCLPPAMASGEYPRWLADVQARAARAGISVDIRPDDGIIKLASRIPGPAPQS